MADSDINAVKRFSIITCFVNFFLVEDSVDSNSSLACLSISDDQLTLATADVPASPVGLTVVVGAVSYLVAEHEPDGTGISRLLLESAA